MLDIRIGCIIAKINIQHCDVGYDVPTSWNGSVCPGCMPVMCWMMTQHVLFAVVLLFFMVVD